MKINYFCIKFGIIIDLKDVELKHKYDEKTTFYLNHNF